ncbi:alpha/beta hydrolase family protein [Planctomicrobium sp. SH661]|uniref:alpha/beta hydrolase family protein n=1 Tax=Planctomicrobium sp. SH661 TaxID=3448124 RepID=UPI003F5BA799
MSNPKQRIGPSLPAFIPRLENSPLILLFSALLIGVISFSSFADDSAAEESSAVAPEELPVRQLPRENQLLFRDAQGNSQAVQTVTDWQKRREETLQGLQAILGTMPGPEKRCPLDVRVEEEVDAGTYLQQRITYQSEPDCRVPAFLLIPKKGLHETSPTLPAVLCLHQTDQLGPREIVGLGGNPQLWYAKELAERGYVVLAPNYPLLANYHPDLKKLGWASGLLKAAWDNQRGLDLLDSLPYVKSGKYATIGHSLGGHNSVFTALFDERLKVVISCCGLDAFVDYYQGNPDVWLPERGWTQTRYVPRLAAYRGRLQEIPFDFHEIIASLAPRSVLIVAPLQDSNFRADSVDRIAQAAQPVFNLFGVPENLQIEHPDCGHTFPPQMREKAYLLIDSILK